ncbi:UNVERIFIED_CONTAM: Retrovirus-related Pol polyprotein from type-1 retrotransposable element R2 [Sesamum radiatum]|uniref:Retrovirus-related Pol polyprotein from type-1 retrotransposable element R2 n=1 Tax=Sesamum radiatum TaxID=300843 RepID=A0AAW2SMU7_SESRA
MWIKHHDFLNTVEQPWKHPTGAYGLINFQQKLYRLKQHLKWWNKNVFVDLFDNIKKAQEQVLISESLYNAAPCDANLIDLNRANADLTKILPMEEDFWRQKATYSAAGPDGFSALFYQVCWDIIAQDVLIAVQDFFCCTPMPKNFKATSIALIPKVLNPSVWTDYRPISLCNVSNKICSKIMNDRLSRILPRIIAPSQSGFVGGRLISDNILLAQELIHTLDEKRRYENVVYKLDMAKAYDRVQWQFLYNVLRKMGFNEKWIQLVKNCIEQCWFSVLVNGDKAGFFSSSRGVRQDDPISPSLFIILADDLITRMRAKLLGWKQSMLSHGGRLALIKSTLCSMPLHLIQVLNPPKPILHCIEQIIAKFFWGTTDQHKKIHWTKWKKICQPVKEGGLGIRRMPDVVTAFTFKLWWRF